MHYIKEILLTLFLLLFAIQQLNTSPCAEEETIELRSQKEVDEFTNKYPDCTEILGDLVIVDDNGDIINLSPLSNIEKINGNLTIKNCDKIENLDAFSNLSSLGSDLIIENNDSLSDITGLRNMELKIVRLKNSSLFIIKSNKNLLSLRGLEKIDTLGYEVEISNNDRLKSLEGLNNLVTAGDFRFGHYVVYPGHFIISENDSLKNLNGLESLKTVNGSFKILNNKSLMSLKGLKNLSQVTKYVYYNPTEQETNSGFAITGNKKLSFCSIETSICSYYDKYNTVTIEDNSDSCNTLEEVLSFCSPTNVEVEKPKEEVQLHPNPTTGIINISGSFPPGTKVKIFDNLGRLVLLQDLSKSNVVDISSQSSGVYFIKIENKEINTFEMIVKE